MNKGAHLLPGFQQLAVVVQVGVVNHAADIVGNISLQNGEKGIGGEKFHRAVQQLPLLLGRGTDHLLQQQAARQNRFAGANFVVQPFKGQASNIFFTQRGQDIGDIAAKQVVWGDDDDVVGIQLLGDPFVQQKGDPVQGNRGFSAAGNALHEKQFVLRITDNHVLLSLNGLYNRAHLWRGVVGERLTQQVVHDVYVRVEEVVESAFFNFKLPLERYSATDGAGRCLIFHRTGFVAVEQTGNRCAPVVDVGLIGVLVLNGEQTDVDALGGGGLKALFGEVDSCKVRRIQRLPVVVDPLVGSVIPAGLRLDGFECLMCLDRIVEAAAEGNIFPHFLAGRDNLFLFVGAGLLFPLQVFPNEGAGLVQILLFLYKFFFVFHANPPSSGGLFVSISYYYIIVAGG